ncbi:hypothetical protein LTR86_005048 [Recurvomyces mirabilis]|nr:hypothetical protein LTR86_005048 [Recurvomyces mirabilis]
MARYPTFEEYEKKGNFVDGIKRCDDLLKKTPKDVRLLTTKLQLLHATGRKDDFQVILDELPGLQPPIQDLHDLIAIEQIVVDSQEDVYPRPSTAGPVLSKLWDNAIKTSSSSNQKHELVSMRFERAILANRSIDAQQSLIQLKALQPKNRMVYMAHAAFTQLISKFNDDLQARLAIGLARKAVNEKFDDDKALDCRVPGQIFATQESSKDLESVQGKSFQESKQVLDARRKASKSEAKNGGVASASTQSTSTNSSYLQGRIEDSKTKFAALIKSDKSAGTVRSFATEAIDLFQLSRKEGTRRQPADACFVAISALVRLFELSDDAAYLLHAAYLAETLLKHNQHIHEARLILVYLYMRLDLGSQAMRLFDSLSIKEVQHDTVGHALFTRLSSIHPHSTSWSSKEVMDPLKRTSHALGVYVRCEEKLVDCEAGVLSSGQTGMIFDLQELRDSLRTSWSRRMILLEQRRIERLMKGTVDGKDAAAEAMGPMVCENWLQTKDNRDFDAAFDYSYNVEKVLHDRSGGVLPGKAWILYTLAADCAFSLANAKSALVKNPEDVAKQAQTLKSASKTSDSSNQSAARSDLTPAERQAGDIACTTIDVLLLNSKATAASDEVSTKLISLTTMVEDLEITTLVKDTETLTSHLQISYIYTDILRTVTLACRHLRPKAGVTLGKEIQELQDKCKADIAAIQTYAVEQQARIKASEVRQMMAKDEGMWKGLNVLGEGGEGIDGFCEAVAKAAKEGWEGIGRIKML